MEVKVDLAQTLIKGIKPTPKNAIFEDRTIVTRANLSSTIDGGINVDVGNEIQSKKLNAFNVVANVSNNSGNVSDDVAKNFNANIKGHFKKAQKIIDSGKYGDDAEIERARLKGFIDGFKGFDERDIPQESQDDFKSLKNKLDDLMQKKWTRRIAAK